MRQFLTRLEPAFAVYLSVTRFVLSAIAILMFAVMLAANSYNIILRALYGTGITWHQEVSILAAFWIYFGAYALICKDDSYIRIELLVDRFAAAVQQPLLIIIRLAVIAFHAVLFVLCLKTLRIVSLYETPILQWPEYLFYIPLTVGTADIVLTECIYLLQILFLGKPAKTTARPAY